jgi:large subunit ribosomal protein L4
VKVNRKARRKALRAALSVHADRDSIAVLDTEAFSDPSTKTAAETLTKWGARTPTLVVLGAEEDTIQKSFRNIRGMTVVPAAAVGVADVIGHRSIVVTQAALDVLESRAGDVTRGRGDDSAQDGDE